MIKRGIHIILLLSIGASACGQLIPVLDQYFTNRLAVNPAYTGSQDGLQADIYSRRQWVGFEGAPRTLSLSMHGPIGQKKVNLGLIVYSDQYGSNKESGILINYAYRIGFRNGDLFLGMAAGLTSLSTDMEAFINSQAGDILLRDPARRAYLPEFSIGSYYQTDRYFVGLSMPFFISHPLSPSNGQYSVGFNLSAANYILIGGFIARLSGDFELFPSLMLKSNPASSTQLDINCNVIFRERIWLGSSIRTNGNLSGILQLQVTPQLRIGYSYGYEISELSKYQRGSHEVMLSYGFNYMLEVPSPRYF